jgi:predicted nucleotidyltransferase
MTASLDSKRYRINEFCLKWGIRELALFGSAVRDDFRPDSDFDFLVSFSPNVA